MSQKKRTHSKSRTTASLKHWPWLVFALVVTAVVVLSAGRFRSTPPEAATPSMPPASMVKGSSGAPVTIVEFSDYQ